MLSEAVERYLIINIGHTKTKCFRLTGNKITRSSFARFYRFSLILNYFKTEIGNLKLFRQKYLTNQNFISNMFGVVVVVLPDIVLKRDGSNMDADSVHPSRWTLDGGTTIAMS